MSVCFVSGNFMDFSVPWVFTNYFLCNILCLLPIFENLRIRIKYLISLCATMCVLRSVAISYTHDVLCYAKIRDSRDDESFCLKNRSVADFGFVYHLSLDHRWQITGNTHSMQGCNNTIQDANLTQWWKLEISSIIKTFSTREKKHETWNDVIK